jgi:hypothetical protein
VLFSSSNELSVSSFSKEKLDGKQHEIVEQNPKTTREDGERARRGERARIRVSYWDLGFETSIPAEQRTKVACERGDGLGFHFGICILGPRFRANCVWKVARERARIRASY